MEFSLFYITVKDKQEAIIIGRTLVQKHLAACANIVDSVQSLYYWEEKLCEESEAILIVKTRKELAASLIEKVKEIHSYTCPCIVEVPILSGNPDFLKWIETQTET